MSSNVDASCQTNVTIAPSDVMRCFLTCLPIDAELGVPRHGNAAPQQAIVWYRRVKEWAVRRSIPRLNLENFVSGDRRRRVFWTESRDPVDWKSPVFPIEFTGPIDERAIYQHA